MTIYMVRQSYIIKIMLSGIAILNTGYLDYINDYYLKLKLNSIAKIWTYGSIIMFPAPKPEIK